MGAGHPRAAQSSPQWRRKRLVLWNPGRVDSLNDDTLPVSDSAHETSYSYYQEGDILTYTKIEKVHIPV
jgi:hypothetical protein